MHVLQCSSSCFSPLFVSSLRRQPLRSFGLKNIFDGFKSASFQIGREFGFQLKLPFFGCNSLQVCFAFLQSIHIIKFVLTQYCNKVDILNVGVAWSVRLHTAGLSPLAPTALDSRAHNFLTHSNTFRFCSMVRLHRYVAVRGYLKSLQSANVY